MKPPAKTKPSFKTVDDLVEEAAATVDLATVAPDSGGKDKKLVVTIPGGLHKKAKLFTVEQGITLRSFVIAAMEKALTEAKQ